MEVIILCVKLLFMLVEIVLSGSCSSRRYVNVFDKLNKVFLFMYSFVSVYLRVKILVFGSNFVGFLLSMLFVMDVFLFENCSGAM